MAWNPTNITPYLRPSSVIKISRSFASAATKKNEAEKSYFYPREPLKTSSQDNVTISSVETNKPVSKLAVYFKAGSRYESDGIQGVSHALKVYTGLGTSGATQFGLTRSIDFAGGKLTCTAGREHIAYTLEATRNQIQGLEKFLKDASVNQAFKPWELAEHLPRLRLDRILRSPETRTMELLHRAAYRKGLGYSLYSPKYMVGKHDTEMLLHFVANNFVEASVVGLGLPHEQVTEFAGRLNVKKGNRKVEAQKYYAGGEIRKESGGDLAYVALTLEGAGLNKPKEVLASALVHRALGSGPRTKRGLDGGKLTAITKDTPVESAASGFSASYSDSGLVGVFITASSCCIEGLTKKASELLRSGSFSDQDLSRAKGILKGDIALALETEEGYFDDIGLQSLHYKKVSSQEEVSKLIDSITTADLNKLVKGSKLSMASYGKIANVPYLDELK